MTSAEIFLPWPDKKLSPNGRYHWGQVARAKKAAKRTAYYTVLEAGIGKIQADEVRITMSFYPPGAYGYDDDGLSARMKAALDGISEAIGIDDSKFRLGEIMRGPIEKAGMVKVTLDWSQAQEEAA